MYYLWVVLFGLSLFHLINAFFDPVSIAAGAAGVGYALYQSTYCSYYECCNKQYITANIHGNYNMIVSKLN